MNLGRAGSMKMEVRRESSVCDVVARLQGSRLGLVPARKVAT